MRNTVGWETGCIIQMVCSIHEGRLVPELEEEKRD